MIDLGPPPAIIQPSRGIIKPPRFSILPGFGAPVIDAGKELRYIGHVDSGTDTSSYTFNNVPIGDPDPDRLVVVCVVGQTNNGRHPNSITINGNAATIHQSAGVRPEANNHPYGAMASLSVANGTTANIVITNTGTTRCCSVVIYTLTGLVSQTPFHSVIDVSWASDTTTLLPLNVPENGVAIAIAGDCDQNWGPYTWVGLTKDLHYYLTGEFDYETASAVNLSAQTPRDIQFLLTTANTDKMGIAVSWA